MTDQADLAALLAREEIRTVIHTYCRAIDRMDGDLLRSCYHEDAIQDHGGIFLGPREPWVEETMEALEVMNATLHYVTNTIIELEGDTAYAETYVMATHDMEDEQGDRGLMIMAGRYIDRFEKRAGKWKIARRALMVDWTQRQPLVVGLGHEAPNGPFNEWVLRMGMRSPQDPAYLERAKALLQ
jgi:ketosteroid isomerase-like protein